MPKISIADRKDINKPAKFSDGRVAEDAPPQTLSTEKNPAAVALGRLGGLKGGKARKEKLTPEERSAIARKAAKTRWIKKNGTGAEDRKMRWSKKLSKSDAQQETRGARMPFLRFTKGRSVLNNHLTDFRNIFFAALNWRRKISQFGHPIEEATINIHVVLGGQDLGVRQMRLDHDPERTRNHRAPTTHLHYDQRTRLALERVNLAGHTVVVQATGGGYSLEVV